jgi:hypothetical protein
MAAYTTIDDPSAHFKVQLYTGTGSSQSITFNDTDTTMQPDKVWIKSVDANSHGNFDVLRGVNESFKTEGEDKETTRTDALSAFDSNGFSFNGGHVTVNESSNTYVAWCWKGNGSGSANTTGSINTTATSANATAGFSLSTYTGNSTSGATIGHGLGAVPHFIIVKNRAADLSWQIYHAANTAAPETDYLVLDTTAATSDAADRWNDTAPTSSVVTLGDGDQVNDNAVGFVAYCWAPIQGYSKFGSYTGNGNADGPFIYTGFRPACVIIKIYAGSGTANWYIFDNKRLGYNVDNNFAYPNLSNADGTTDVIDLLANGFKIRATEFGLNADDKSMVFMAFAEAPLVNSNGVPCNAR